MATKLAAHQVNSWRLSRHHLIHRAKKRELAGVVSEVCGIQAQILPAAELAIRARVEGVHRQDVLDALWEKHTLLKTWCMRGTLHFLTASDLPLYVAALRTKLEEARLWLQKDAGVAPSEVDAISGEITRALSRAELSREDLAKEVERRLSLSRKTKGYLRSPWGVMLRPAAYQGGLAFGEGVGSRVTFVGPSGWVSPWDEPSTEEAFASLFRRFIRCYGPATIGDFSRWWGGLHERGKSILQSARGDLEEVVCGEYRGLMQQRDAEEASGLEAPRSVSLLPSFDCYATFYTPRESFVAETHRSRIFRKTAGWIYPSVVVDGMAAGAWSLKRRARNVVVDVEPFRAMSLREKKGVAEEAADIGEFLGTRAEVRYLGGG